MTNNNMIFVANWKMHGNFNDISKVNTVLNLIKSKNIKILRLFIAHHSQCLNPFQIILKILNLI